MIIWNGQNRLGVGGSCPGASGAWSGARVRQRGEEKEDVGTEGRALDFQAE